MADVEALRKGAKYAYKARQYAEAAELYAQVIAADPDPSAAAAAADRTGYGYALASLSRLEEAAVQLQAAVSYAPQDAKLRHKLGEILSRLDRHSAAVEQLMEATRLAPDEADHQVRLAMELRAIGRTGEARRVLDRSLELDPNNTAARIEQLALGGFERDGQAAEAAAEANVAVVRADQLQPELAGITFSGRSKWDLPTLAAPKPMRHRLWIVAMEGVALTLVAMWLRSLM